MEAISKEFGFSPNELEQLTRTPAWREIVKERASFRAGKLTDQIHDVGERVMATARKLNSRLDEVLDQATLAPADLKDAADALKSVAITAKSLSEAVSGNETVNQQTNNFVNYLHIVDNPK